MSSQGRMEGDGRGSAADAACEGGVSAQQHLPGHQLLREHVSPRMWGLSRQPCFQAWLTVLWASISCPFTLIIGFQGQYLNIF